MKTKTKYQQAKTALKLEAIEAKKIFKHDKPAIRQAINDKAYFLTMDYDLSSHKLELLHNYAASLHP